MQRITHYELLGIDKNASPFELKTAYHAMIRKWHPDKCQNFKDLAQRTTMKINKAYEILSNSEKKQAYDRDLEILKNTPRTPWNGYNFDGHYESDSDQSFSMDMDEITKQIHEMSDKITKKKVLRRKQKRIQKL